MIAAVALAVTLTPLGKFTVAGMDGAQFIAVFIGGLIGMIMMRFAATLSVCFKNFPCLSLPPFLLVGWVWCKVVDPELAHPRVAVLAAAFPNSFAWTAIFWTVFVGILMSGYLVAKKQRHAEEQEFYG